MYFSGQGKLLVAVRDALGNPGLFRHVGNVPEAKISLNTDNIEHMESVSGQRLQDLRIPKSKKCEVMFSMEDFNEDNLALAFMGTKLTQTGASVTGELVPSGAAVGDIYRTKFPKVSAVVVKDSTGTPKTLTLGTNYTLNADHGSVVFTDVTTGGPYTQPFKVDYTYATLTNGIVSMFSAAQQERWIRFEGLNTANTNKPVLIELYRAVLDPVKDYAMLNDDLLKMDLSGSVLYDSIRAYDAQLGYFGRIINL